MADEEIPVQMYDTFEHEADIGIIGYGLNLEEAFENAAKALFDIMFDLKSVVESKEWRVQCAASDQEALFIEWLNELISLADMDNLVFSRFNVEIMDNHLKGIAFGEPLESSRHKPKVQVKGATYSSLKISRKGKYITVKCILDV